MVLLGRVLLLGEIQYFLAAGTNGYPNHCDKMEAVLSVMSPSGYIVATRSWLFTKWQKFRLVKIESICRQQNKCHLKIEICFRRSRKHCGKRRKWWLPFFTTQSRLLTTLKQRAFENILGKGENAGNHNFLLFPQCFLPFPNQFSILHSHLFYRLQMLSIWTSVRFCQELTHSHTMTFFDAPWKQGFWKHCRKRRKCW